MVYPCGTPTGAQDAHLAVRGDRLGDELPEAAGLVCAVRGLVLLVNPSQAWFTRVEPNRRAGCSPGSQRRSSWG